VSETSPPRAQAREPTPAGALVIAVDTGGTFTDVVCWRHDVVTVHKVPSTPDDPARAVIDGLQAVLARTETGTPAAMTTATKPTATPGFTLIHGSTVGTNALLERRGARVALITNRGFEDIIEIGRQYRPQLYALVGHRPPPLVAVEDRHGIAGRLGPRGQELEPLDDAELAALPDRVAGVGSIAICLLHSYADPDQEERVAQALARLDLPLSVSSRLLPEYREYERTATTVVNAFIAPRMHHYLGRIGQDSGAARVRIMGSAGGALPLDRARAEPVHTVLSGPAGGVVGALERARHAGLRDILTFDMGGTSTDVSLCPGAPLQTREFEIAGLPVAVPVLDIHTVGAGGGSLAWIDAGGALRVGPQSAGADPGPICYGYGAADVTVTDAHVWLGRLPADAFLGGEVVLDRNAIAGPLQSLARRLGLSPDRTAEGIIALADVAMEGALRVISVERGYDPAGFTLLPFGGAAGLHAAELARRLGVPRVLVPPDPGVLSAYGMLVSPVSKEAARTVLLAAGAQADAALATTFAALERDVVDAMRDEGLDPAGLRIQRAIDARYRGQSFELRVEADAWVDRFHEMHHTRYGYALLQETVEAVTLRVLATSPPLSPPPVDLPAATHVEPPEAGRTPVTYAGQRLDAARLNRPALRPGHLIHGPAVITEYSATTWLPPGWQAEVRSDGALLAVRTPDRGRS
jgi:N-methylhydantoinase A